jgi:hypothetical protein
MLDGWYLELFLPPLANRPKPTETVFTGIFAPRKSNQTVPPSAFHSALRPPMTLDFGCWTLGAWSFSYPLPLFLSEQRRTKAYFQPLATPRSNVHPVRGTHLPQVAMCKHFSTFPLPADIRSYAHLPADSRGIARLQTPNFAYFGCGRLQRLRGSISVCSVNSCSSPVRSTQYAPRNIYGFSKNNAGRCGIRTRSCATRLIGPHGSGCFLPRV